jgi:multidrug efflux system membrane fusion protein
VTLDQGNVASAQLNLNYCQINAPAAGLAGPLLVDAGNYVQSTAATALVTLTEMQPIYVNFSIPETEFDEVRRYQAKSPLEVDAYSQAGKKVAVGRVSLIDNQANTATGTVLLQATFPNADEALWPGAFVSVQLVVYTRQNAIVVPDATVMAGPTGSYVYVIQPDDTVQRVAVTVGARQDGIDVISKGLTAGQQVVTNGQYRLDDKTKVTIQPTTSSAPSS